KYKIFDRFWRPDWDQYARIFRIGIPIAGISLLEAGFFISAVFVMGRFGAIAIAAHMIAIQLPHITFMVPMGSPRRQWYGWDTRQAGAIFRPRIAPDGWPLVSRAGSWRRRR
ncbi:MAG: hypothetical protein OEM91_16745, partial [Hyphomicrobiales bacterium]|nr:hypothetical protein [Hyphomicrobiales bacterium]